MFGVRLEKERRRVDGNGGEAAEFSVANHYSIRIRLQY